jgi:Na+-driven multidrug efflux pump
LDSSLSSAAANLTIVVLDVLWIPRYGVLGAACASLIAYSVAFVLVGATFCRVTGLSVGEAYGYRREDLGAMARISGRFARRAGLASGAG